MTGKRKITLPVKRNNKFNFTTQTTITGVNNAFTKKNLFRTQSTQLVCNRRPTDRPSLTKTFSE